VLQLGQKRDADFPNVPLATEVVKADKKALVDLITANCELGRLVAAPPDLPAARRLALVEAFKKSLTDPDLLDKAKKADLMIAPAYGDDVAALIKNALNQKASDLAKLKEILEPATKE
jgi:hypothetical protein